eukprot:gene39751-49125_t
MLGWSFEGTTVSSYLTTSPTIVAGLTLSSLDQIEVTSAQMGGASVNSGTPVTAQLCVDTLDAQTTTSRSYLLGSYDGFLTTKMVRIALSVSGGQLYVTATDAKNMALNFAGSCLTMNTAWLTGGVVSVATSGASSGYGVVNLMLTQLSVGPTALPSMLPSIILTTVPTRLPTIVPTTVGPTFSPSAAPTRPLTRYWRITVVTTNPSFWEVYIYELYFFDTAYAQLSGVYGSSRGGDMSLAYDGNSGTSYRFPPATGLTAGDWLSFTCNSACSIGEVTMLQFATSDNQIFSMRLEYSLDAGTTWASEYSAFATPQVTTYIVPVPTNNPTMTPTRQPTSQPSSVPSLQPFGRPTG